MQVLNSIFNISFKGGYDCHTHCGSTSHISVPSTISDTVEIGGKKYEYVDPLKSIARANKRMNKADKINDGVFISNLDCMSRDESKPVPFIEDEVDGNLKMYEAYKDNKKAYLYATCQAGYGNVQNIKDVMAKTNNGFVGLKFHPQELRRKANDKAYEPYIAYAQEKNLPCLFHTQVAVDWSLGGVLMPKWEPSDPRYIYELAKKYPKTPIILGHTGSGGSPAHQVALDVLKESIKNNDANLYAEISWMDFTPDGYPSDNPQKLLSLIKMLKENDALDRVVFGTDCPIGRYGMDYGTNGVPKGARSPEVMYKDSVIAVKNAIRKDKDLAADAEVIIDKIFKTNCEKLFSINK